MKNPVSRSIRVSGPSIACAGLIALATGIVHAQSGRDYISIVGSSTVYPFSTVVAERFGRSTQFRTPTVESTGSGGGLKLFCNGIGVQHPDIANSSRRIKASEVQSCARNNVADIVEVKIGYDGIAIANSKRGPEFDLSLREVYLALAKNVPDPAGGNALVANPYRRWSDITPALPAIDIEVLGPPPTSGTRDAFLELAMEGGCQTFASIEALSGNDYAAACHTIREDGRYVEAGENDNLIVQKLDANPAALGIFGFSFLDQNADKMRGSMIEGVAPDFETIAAGEYPISRPLYFYVKKQHIGTIPGIREFLQEFMSEAAAGDFGYLSDKGLIPLPEDERRSVMASVDRLERLELADISQ
jgi:phosphate transport system substrate-binding protein